MEIAKVVGVTLLFFIAVVLLTSGRAFSAEIDLKRSERQRAILADEAEELRKHDAKQAGRRPEVAPRSGMRPNFQRICIIKPVMADKEIEACRVSYQRKDI